MADLPGLVFETEPRELQHTAEPVQVTIDGQTYTANQPQDFVLEDLSFAMSSMASQSDKGFAMRALLQDCLDPMDWVLLKARMEDRNDSLRSYAQLAPAVIGICEWFGADTTAWDTGGEDSEGRSPAPVPAAKTRGNYGRPYRPGRGR